MRFKPQQQIVCINKQNWIDEFGSIVRGPRHNEVCTVVGYECPGYAMLEGYSKTDGYYDKCFAPLITDEQLTEALKEVPETVEV